MDTHKPKYRVEVKTNGQWRPWIDRYGTGKASDYIYPVFADLLAQRIYNLHGFESRVTELT